MNRNGSGFLLNGIPQQIPLLATGPRIFISHASADKEFCDIFVELLTSIGFTERTIIYTSRSEFGVPNGVEIFDYLRTNLGNRQLWVFFMLSENFYSSPYCLNEMGAAWVRQNKSHNILLPKFGHKDVRGVVSKNQLALDLCDPVRLTELLQEFRKIWQLPISPTMWAGIQQNFISKMKKMYG